MRIKTDINEVIDLDCNVRSPYATNIKKKKTHGGKNTNHYQTEKS